MSAPVDTNNEGNGESELDEWLQQNRLMNIRDIFKKNEVVLQDLVDLSSSSIDDLKGYARDELGLNLMNGMKFAKAVAALKSQQQQQATSKPAVIEKVIRIVMSAEEETAINKIHKRQQTIKDKINTVTNDMDILKKLAKSNENEVNEFRKQAMERLNQRMDAIITKSNGEINKKEVAISEYVDKLKAYNKSLNDANSQTDDLLTDQDMDKIKRKTKIIGISEDMLKIEMKELNVTPMVKVEIDTNEVMGYLDGIGRVNSYNVPEKPRISVNDIKENSATVRFMNVKKEYECLVELCENYGGNDDDEKKMEDEWKELCLVKNESQYEMKGLKDDRVHGVRVKYKNKHGFGALCKAVMFKTNKKEKISLPSSILTATEKQTFLALLKQNGKTLGKSWNLIYRATTDGLNRNAFINKVHGKPNVICFIQTEGNNVCGGYTSTGWEKGKGSNTYSRDDKAFVFGIRSSKNYAPIICNVKPNSSYGKDALGYASSYYCIFGSSYITYIHNNGTLYHQNPDNYDSFPNHQQLLGGKYNEKVRDIEVFELK